MSPSFPREFQPTVLRIPSLVAFGVTPTGLSPSKAGRSRPLRLSPRGIGPGPATPHLPELSPGNSVWTLPRSVAHTNGIAFAFFSCGYSDASFPRVPDPYGSSPKGQDIPFGHPRFKGSLRLPEDFRSLARPSSAPELSHPPAGIIAGNAWLIPVCTWGNGPLHGLTCQQASTLPRRLSHRRVHKLWTRRDLNPRPPPRKGGALPAELRALG